MGQRPATAALQLTRARNGQVCVCTWRPRRDRSASRIRPAAGTPAPEVAEIERLRSGDGTPAGAPAQLKGAILALARVVHDVRVRGVSLPADASEALAQLSGLPAPLGAVGVFLRDVAGGASPSVPPGLPSEVGEILERLREAVGIGGEPTGDEAPPCP